jgi:hypothetical protein
MFWGELRFTLLSIILMHLGTESLDRIVRILSLNWGERGLITCRDTVHPEVLHGSAKVLQVACR